MDDSSKIAKRLTLSASKRMMDYLAHRRHSEKELRQKLAAHHSHEEIENAIIYGKTHGWIPASEEAVLELSEQTAAKLRRKGKGSHYINEYLLEKGLPSIEMDDVDELEKAQQLVKNKFTPLENSSGEEQEKLKAKIGRFLVSRGFDMEIVRKVIYED